MGINRRRPLVQHGGMLYHTIVRTLRCWRLGCTQGGEHLCGGWEVQQQLKPRDRTTIVDSLAVRGGWGILRRTAWLCALYDSGSSFSSSCSTRLRRKQMRRRSSEG